MESVLILGAGFGGLEVATRLSGGDFDVTLIDRNDGFTFGFAKFEVLFGRSTPEQIKLPYSEISKPGVTFKREEIVSIDPTTRRVVTDRASYDPDVLVVALGADYAPDATPGFVEGGYEFYSVAGAGRLGNALTHFEGGTILLGVLGVPYKCPPAPYECLFLMDDYFKERGIVVDFQLVNPMPTPIPPSPQASDAIKKAMDARNITYTFGQRVHSIDPSTKTAALGSGASLSYDLFIGIPVHKAPTVVQEAGLTDGGTDGWIKVDKTNLRTPYDGVWALGDCADAPVPRAGTLAENAARAVADDIMGKLDEPYEGRGICFVEFGGGEIGMVHVDFLTGPAPQAPLEGPSRELMANKAEFGRDRRQRWFGRSE